MPSRILHHKRAAKEIKQTGKESLLGLSKTRVRDWYMRNNDGGLIAKSRKCPPYYVPRGSEMLFQVTGLGQLCLLHLHSILRHLPFFSIQPSSFPDQSISYP
eukprot:c21000_g1_i1 orf=1-303(-)